MTSSPVLPLTVSGALGELMVENQRIADHFDNGAAAADSLEQAAVALKDADRVFVLGAGRSGLALQMTAMRLMHLGLDAYVVGDATTPAIAKGDALLVASGSGTTAGILRSATTAADVGAAVIALTTDASSPLADVATITVAVPAAQKQAHGGTLSVQYAGGLFEQSVLLVGDAIFHSLWKQSGLTADDIWPRHSNLE
ncbi:MAG TPA: 6-phospho-3-hexuloisomerase [Glaciihabitans sp.]|nr:6-phospho-3-hexuloisomerase [Glaciihabitans sp.]